MKPEDKKRPNGVKEEFARMAVSTGNVVGLTVLLHASCGADADPPRGGWSTSGLGSDLKILQLGF